MKRLNGEKLIDDFGLEYFSEGSSFGALAKNAIKFLLTEGKIWGFDKKEIIFDTGDRGDSFFIVLKGKIAFYMPFRDELALLREYGFGEEFGCVAMIGLHDRIGQGKAIEPSIALEISSSLFSEMHDRYPAEFGVFLLNLSREMARSIRLLSSTLAKHEILHQEIK